jgi:hypothetical protein
MTYAAFGIHRKLVEEEGFDPQSEEYYSEVNRRMRTEFPHRFAGKKIGWNAGRLCCFFSIPQHCKTGAQVGQTFAVSNSDSQKTWCAA